ncbi:hypothetical protein NAAC61_10400 [Petrotoga sp. 8T1HF07.NaAc.6.1]|nr:hypothetical protein [Petrotoga sp. 8T1HF07.NaAc.6.1]
MEFLPLIFNYLENNYNTKQYTKANKKLLEIFIFFNKFECKNEKLKIIYGIMVYSIIKEEGGGRLCNITI